MGLVLLGAAAGVAKQAPATSDASEICPAVASGDYERNRAPVTTGLLSGVTFPSDRTQLPSTGGGSGQQAMDICLIKADGNLTWHGKAAARVEVRPGDKTASTGAQGFDHGGDVDGRSDILWDRPTARVTRVALQQVSGTNNGLAANATNTHDFNGDGKSDILWRNTNGDVAIWLMNGLQYLSGGDLGNAPTSWSIVGTGDFNGDGFSDILWRNTNGDVAIWLMNGLQYLSGGDLGNTPTSWSIVGTGDFNGDGRSDILWRNTNGDVAIWLMDGLQYLSGGDLGNAPITWSIVGTGDFNGDGKSDILWRNTNGDVAIWLMNGLQYLSGGDLGNAPITWSIVGTGDFNGDGNSDILWRNTSQRYLKFSASSLLN